MSSHISPEAVKKSTDSANYYSLSYCCAWPCSEGRSDLYNERSCADDHSESIVQSNYYGIRISNNYSCPVAFRPPLAKFLQGILALSPRMLLTRNDRTNQTEYTTRFTAPCQRIMLHHLHVLWTMVS